MATLTASGITYGDGSSSATANAINNIGSIAELYSTYRPGAYTTWQNSTVSGSYLYYRTGGNVQQGAGQPTGNRVNATSTFTTTDANNGASSTYNSVGGTWRITGMPLNWVDYDPCNNATFLSRTMFVRIA